MIKKVIIQNFQSHKNTELDLVPGVNIIIGKTDSGKTAILRALRWLIKNRPGGEAFRSVWGGKTEVKISTTEGGIITRGKGDDNYYDVNSLHLVAFKTEVPEEVSSILNLSDINLHHQFDQPFLLNSTSGEVATHFNKIAHIEQIDISTKRVKGWITDIKQNIAENTSQIDKYNIDLKKYKNLDKLEIELEVLENLDQSLTKIINIRAEFLNLLDNIHDTEKEIETYSDILQLENQVNSLLAIYNVIEATETECDNFLQLIDTINSSKKSISEEEVLINLESSVNNILNLYTEEENIELEKEELLTLTKKISIKKSKIASLEIIEIPKLQEELKKEMPDICPLCDQPIPHSHESI